MSDFPIETERLWLRPFCQDDLESFVAYRNDPLVAEYQGWDLPYIRQQAVAFLDEMASAVPSVPGHWYQIALEAKEMGVLIGDCAFCCLSDDPRQAEIGFSLARSYQGKGYGVEAVNALLGYLFDTQGLHRVRAICDVENSASARLLERVGMRREGHFIENLYVKGRWSSEYWYAILRREWIAQKRVSGL